MTALIEGVVIIYFLSKKLSTKSLLYVTGLIQIICCLTSNYRGFFAEDGFLIQIVSLYPGTIYNSVLAGLWWIALGKYIAEKEKEVCLNEIKCLPVFILISFAALYAEQLLIYRLDCSHANDVYFLLTPVVILTFCYVKNLDIRIQCATQLRVLSTITYCAHIAFGSIYGTIVQFVFNTDMSGAVFVITLISCFVLTIIINLLEDKRYFTWLKYAH